MDMPVSLDHGRYVVLIPRGNPGMSEVYLSTDTQQNHRRVAIKLVRIDINRHPNWQADVTEFNREPRIITALSDKRIVEVYGYKAEQQGDEVFAYMVMRYYEEGSLQNWLTNHRGTRPLRVGEVATLLQRAGDAVQLVHNNRIVHRDIKHGNFLAESRQRPSDLPDLVLTDFGLAWFLEGDDATLDNKGTYRFMAPEQFRPREVPRFENDQYALAVMAYHLLTERYPFDGKRSEVEDRHNRNELPISPSNHRRGISKRVDRVILRALDNEPARRYPDVKTFTKELKKASRPRFIPITLGLIAALVIIVSVLAFVIPGHGTSCATSPFPSTDLSSYPLPPTQTASDCEQIGLSVGTRFFDSTTNDPYQGQKKEIADKIASGQSSLSVHELQTLTEKGSDSNDAEALIYEEDQNILSSSYPYFTVVLGLGFSPILIGGTHDVLQSAYTLQYQWDHVLHPGFNQPQLLLVLANTGLDSTDANAKYVIPQIVALSTNKTTNPNFVGIVGWEDSTSTLNAINELGKQPITMISPSASGTNVKGVNFFRIVPDNDSQARLAAAFALTKWPTAKNIAIITTSITSSTGNYPTDLGTKFQQNLADLKQGISTPYYYYTFNDSTTIDTAVTNVLTAKPDLIFFSGYAGDLETVLKEQAKNPDPQLKAIPIIAGDSASVISDYYHGLPPGFDHTYFTAFASQEFVQQEVTSHMIKKLPDFYSAFLQRFPTPALSNDVDEDAILEYDALGALLNGYQISSNQSTLSSTLRTMGTYQGVSGQITFDTSVNPTYKTVVLEHLVNNQLQVPDSAYCNHYQVKDQTTPCLDLTLPLKA